MFARVDLNCLNTGKGWNQFWLVVVSSCHLQYSGVFEKAKCGVVVARNHTDSVAAQRFLELEAKNSLGVCVSA